MLKLNGPTALPRRDTGQSLQPVPACPADAPEPNLDAADDRACAPENNHLGTGRTQPSDSTHNDFSDKPCANTYADGNRGDNPPIASTKDYSYLSGLASSLVPVRIPVEELEVSASITNAPSPLIMSIADNGLIFSPPLPGAPADCTSERGRVAEVPSAGRSSGSRRAKPAPLSATVVMFH
ncbi:hypothetical protein QCA50_010778 [Cerrena zonata]|uniref:Uncharacterized protein n=1 Tax=Cerrena zonata TaxID=2478898 RepID=A0AAW0G7K6_9APHY